MTRKQLQDIKNHLQEIDEGKNHKCWPIISFNGKDADLDDRGCTGIKFIAPTPASNTVWISIGGHKTFTPASEDDFDGNKKLQDRYNDSAQDIIAGIGFHVNWTGDDWNCFYDITILISVPENDHEEACNEIIRRAQDELTCFCDAMEKASKSMDDIWNQISQGDEEEV